MTELKFQCPACGQHVQCDLKHAGENFPCPACAAIIRVPAGETAAEDTVLNGPDSGAQQNDTEKASYQPLDSPQRPAEGAVVAPSAKTASLDGKVFNPATVHVPELHCTCPVCKSDLRISVRIEDFHAHPQMQEHLSIEERERHIAAARESQPISPYPPLKPRLDRILGKDAQEAA